MTMPFLQKIRDRFMKPAGQRSRSNQQTQNRDDANRAMDAMKKRR